MLKQCPPSRFLYHLNSNIENEVNLNLNDWGEGGMDGNGDASAIDGFLRNQVGQPNNLQERPNQQNLNNISNNENNNVVSNQNDNNLRPLKFQFAIEKVNDALIQAPD